MLDIAPIRALYEKLPAAHAHARKVLGHDLTLGEKILWSHMADPRQPALARGKDFALLQPDRVALQDATAQMAILQFMQSGKAKVATPTTIHCDHLIQARVGAKDDLSAALDTNREVYEFLRSAGARYGMGFWKPGAGIIHQVVLENYAFPGGLMLGTDSHTPNAGGMGMAAVGVGGADAVDAMVGMPWEVLYPSFVAVVLKGKLGGWTSGKDIILKVLEQLTVEGGTNRIVEYVGEGVQSISLTGRATVTNMGAELGATTSLFPFDERTGAYLRKTNRANVADLAAKHAAALRQDAAVTKSPEKFCDLVLEIDLSTLEPYVVGPHSPDLARPISRLKDDAKKNNYPTRLTAALIGSCTNSSYEDMGRSAHVARQATAKGAKAVTAFWVTPGSEQVHLTIQRDGQAKALADIGGKVLANACGPCIGQWKRDDIKEGEKNSIISSYNRNFAKRNDGNAGTLSFLASPEIVTALALAGRLDFNPITDDLPGADGKPWRLSPPAAPDLPDKGFLPDTEGFIDPPADGSKVSVAVSPQSKRLQILEPFKRNDPKTFVDMPVLLKAKGKCTTDHISPAGPWLKFRGHLDNISDNMFNGAVNAFTGKAGVGANALTGEKDAPFATIARDYKARGICWVAVGDENYGEGSSREHAAMSPRFLGGGAVITRGFARIHETNLKKQGMLPLTFVNAADYDKVREDDRLTLSGLDTLSPGSRVTLTIAHRDGSSEKVDLKHSFNAEQVKWFTAGSALNLMK
ncbi:MAG: aconitate hydratase [Planctomycetes bacterium]|nr:aconitate hydratase [Planctomycetota bacterium]